MSDEEAQEIARLLSPTTTAPVAINEKPMEKEKETEKDKEDHDNTPDWLSDVLSAPDSSLINSTTQDYRYNLLAVLKKTAIESSLEKL